MQCQIKDLKCCLCWLSTGGEFHAQPESIKMSGCENPCKVLAKIEYENRYRKNSKLSKFQGNTSLCFRVRQQFLQLRQSDVRLLLPEESDDPSTPLPLLWLWHFAVPCSSCGAPWKAVVSCSSCCSWKRPLPALVLEREPGWLPGRRARAGSRTGQGRAALIDSF